MLAVVMALLAALFYALASVLQQRGAAREPHERALQLRLLAGLAKNPLWLVGIGADIAGFILQIVALAHGPLVLVQPLLLTGLLFALPLGAALSGERLGTRDWIGTAVTCVGLAAFLAISDPAKGQGDVGVAKWASLLVCAAALSLTLALVGRRLSPRRRAVCYSGSAGVLYGVAAALAKACAHLGSRGIPFLLSQWQPYMLIVVGIVGMVLAQSAFQAGSLDASLPAMTVADPIVSILVGAIAFRETVAHTPGAVVGEALALGAMVVGVFLLARSRAVQRVHGQPAL
ncbi:MAG: DMT family transporter [Acidimicrobiales bacterium]